MNLSRIARCSVVSCLFWLASAFAAVVPGTPLEAFLREHPRPSSAPEGIVYQVPDDKLEPGKLYHDASADGDRRVTRKREVGSLGQVSTGRNSQVLSGYLKFDVTFRYMSTRESKGKGELTWKINSLGVQINEAELRNRFSNFRAIDPGKALNCARERVNAHEYQHVDDAAVNPVWLYTISTGVDRNPNSLLGTSDRQMLERLDSNLAKELDKQRLLLIALAEARAVYASVCRAASQLEYLLAMSSEGKKTEEYVPELYEMHFQRRGETETKVRERMRNSTYGTVLERVKSAREVFALAQENVLLGSSAKIEVDGKKTSLSYAHVYKVYYVNPLNDSISPFEGYTNMSDPTENEMAEKVAGYKFNIEKMYELIHNQLYKDNEGLKGLADERNQTDVGGNVTRLERKMTALEWLSAVLAALQNNVDENELQRLVVAIIDDPRYTDEKTDKLRADIFRAVGKLVATGKYYDAPGSKQENLIDAVILKDCLCGLKPRPSGTRPFQVKRVLNTAVERFRAKEIVNDEAVKAYTTKRKRDYERYPGRWKLIDDRYDLEMYRDKVLRCCKEVYEEEAKKVEEYYPKIQGILNSGNTQSSQ